MCAEVTEKKHGFPACTISISIANSILKEVHVHLDVIDTYEATCSI